MYVSGLNGDVRLHSGRFGSVGMEMYKGQASRETILPLKGIDADCLVCLEMLTKCRPLYAHLHLLRDYKTQ